MGYHDDDNNYDDDDDDDERIVGINSDHFLDD